MFRLQRIFTQSFSLLRFTGFGLCSNYKYKHSASTLRRFDKLTTYFPNYGLQHSINDIVCTTVPVNVTMSEKLKTVIPRQQDDLLDLSPLLYRPQNIIELPDVSTIDILKVPPVKPIQESNYEPTHYIEAPTRDSVIEKQAARLIVIRRRKMKKHKLRKLRIRMKFEWAKVRQRREMRKEKAFQAGLIAQIKEAEKFDAVKFVEERLQKAHEVPLPRTWKGKRLPFFIIKEKLGIK